jgi:hypothetical protein
MESVLQLTGTDRQFKVGIVTQQDRCLSKLMDQGTFGTTEVVNFDSFWTSYILLGRIPY